MLLVRGAALEGAGSAGISGQVWALGRYGSGGFGVCGCRRSVLFDIDMYDEGICGRLFCLDRRNGMFAYRCP